MRPVRPFLLCQVVGKPRATLASAPSPHRTTARGSAAAVPVRPHGHGLYPLRPPARDPRALHFLSYTPLQHQYYFFACTACLALVDLFGGVRRAADRAPVPVPCGPLCLLDSFAVYGASVVSVVGLYDRSVVGSEANRRRISYDCLVLRVITLGS